MYLTRLFTCATHEYTLFFDLKLGQRWHFSLSLFQYLLIHCRNADCGSTSFQHLVHWLFNDYWTADRGSSSFQQLLHSLFVNYRTADRSSTSFQHLVHCLFNCRTVDRSSSSFDNYFIPYSLTTGLRTAVALHFNT